MLKETEENHNRAHMDSKNNKNNELKDKGKKNLDKNLPTKDSEIPLTRIGNTSGTPLKQVPGTQRGKKISKGNEDDLKRSDNHGPVKKKDRSEDIRGETKITRASKVSDKRVSYQHDQQPKQIDKRSKHGQHPRKNSVKKEHQAKDNTEIKEGQEQYESKIKTWDNDNELSQKHNRRASRRRATVSGRKVYPFAKDVPSYILEDPKFQWLIKENPKTELALESQDLGGFRVNNSDTESSHSDCNENLMDNEWFDNLYTDSSLDSLTDNYYYFVDYKDYVARLSHNANQTSSSNGDNIELIVNMKTQSSDTKGMLHKFRPRKKEKKLEFQTFTTSYVPVFGEITAKQKVIEKAKREKLRSDNPRYLGVDEMSVSTTFLSSFRKDNMAMSLDRCFRIPKDTEPGQQLPVSSLDQVIAAIGFKNTDYFDPEFVLSKLKTALSWAAINTETITKERAQLLLYLAVKIPDSLYRWYPKFVDAVVNRRINSTSVIQGFLNIIEDLHTMKIPIDSIFSHSQMLNKDIDNYCLLKKMNRRVFSTMYRIVKKQYKQLFGTDIPQKTLIILYNIATRYYRSGLFKHMPLLCEIITRGEFENNFQVVGAIIKLISTPHPTIEDISSWCGIKIDKLTEKSPMEDEIK